MMNIKILLVIPLLLIALSEKSFSGAFDFEVAKGLGDETTLEGGNDKMRVRIGGSYRLKFNRQKPVPSILEIQEPSFNMSCSGMSFKGMQFELISTEQLSEAFSQFGSSFGWGVMLGIVSSLPTIGDVFSKIQTFSREIQKLLASGCRLGQALGQGIGNMMVKKAGEWGKENFPKTSSAMKDFAEWSQGNSGDLTASLESSIKGMFGGDDTTKKKVSSELMNVFSINSDSLSLSFLSSMYNITNSSTSASSTMKAIKTDCATNSTSDHEFSFSPSSTTVDVTIYDPVEFPHTLSTSGSYDTDTYQFYVTMYLFIYNYFISSDKVTGYKSLLAELKSTASLLQNSMDGTVSGNAQIKESAKKLSKAIKKIEKKLAEKGFSTNVNATPPEVSFIDFILDGDPTATFYGPKFAVYESSTFEYIQLFAINELQTLSNSSFWGTKMHEWSNLRVKAEAQVECLFKTTSTATVSIDGTDITCNTLPPVILPDARRLLRIYQQSTAGERNKMKTQVIARNLKYMLIAIRDGVKVVSRMIASNNEAPSGKLDGTASEEVKSESLLATSKAPEVEPGIVAINKELEMLTDNITKIVNQKFSSDNSFDIFLDTLDKKHSINSRKEMY